ncbi:hypothetical protein JANAI62_00740 [Jannaschia pagri]|uniref:Uncharacterized protein n=1 Tax=Jannaschia pagri TaxID=2829797 RepID=A0ABQ4NGP2_9RHOB|nr:MULTISPECIES: hypothetical protein [unclassified Jannaschia]GIT93451.1 hypothetical protein JANAI62_00740 [Jannaschia sp. AI_62]
MFIRFVCLLACCATQAAAEGIVPRDGTWTVRSVEANMAEACPPMFQPMADQMVANIGKRDVYEVDWPDAFDPNLASGLNPDGQPVTWDRVDDVTWRASLSGPGKEAVIGTMTVVSETEIQNRVDMDVEKMMEEQGGALSVPDCVLDMTYVMEWKG